MADIRAKQSIQPITVSFVHFHASYQNADLILEIHVSVVTCLNLIFFSMLKYGAAVWPQLLWLCTLPICHYGVCGNLWQFLPVPAKNG